MQIARAYAGVPPLGGVFAMAGYSRYSNLPRFARRQRIYVAVCRYLLPPFQERVYEVSCNHVDGRGHCLARACRRRPSLSRSPRVAVASYNDLISDVTLSAPWPTSRTWAAAADGVMAGDAVQGPGRHRQDAALRRHHPGRRRRRRFGGDIAGYVSCPSPTSNKRWAC